jgi:uncharacterized protein (TIGR03083 family)
MTLGFERRIELVDEQSAALAAAVAAGDLTDPVPGCPDWDLRALMAHHGNVLRGWAQVISAADPSGPPALMNDPGERPWAQPSDDWRGWYVASRRALRDALVAAGENGPAWTWWGEPFTAGAIARHQVQEACVHRWDAETAAGVAVRPLPYDAAVDGVEEFLTVELVAEPQPWTGATVRVGLHAEGVPPWLLIGDAGVLSAHPYEPGPGRADAVVHGDASDAVLLLYGRIGLTSLEVDGQKDAALAIFA